MQSALTPIGFDTWLEQGRALYAQRKSIDWECADWLADGQRRFPEQMKLALIEFASDPIERKKLSRTAKIAASIPEGQRSATLTFDHHAHVADLPPDERLSLLQQASKENMTARALRIVAIERKATLGLGNTQLPDDDPEYAESLKIVRLLNRLPVDSRRDICDMFVSANYGVVSY